MPALPKCHSCRKPVMLRPANPMFPFCSARCKAVDLGKWLGEEFRLSGGPSDERDDAMQSPDEASERDDFGRQGDA
jgi:endogenous inhibitor of DNA gyrase (YacG/DUF329 family)